MHAPGVVAVMFASHSLLSLTALCVCTVAAEVMTLNIGSSVRNPATPAELSGRGVVGLPAVALTE